MFTKVPEPGRVKTRLTEGDSGLSPIDASSLYSAILLDLFDVVTRAAKSVGAKLYVAYTPSDRRRKIQHLLGKRSVPVSFFAQQGRTIEERIAQAFEVAFADGNDVVVLAFGDQPSLDEQFFLEAFRVLQLAVEHKGTHFVLGPNCDGGIYLIGLTRSLRRWFPHAIRHTNPCKAVSQLSLRSLSAHVPCTVLDESIDLDDTLDLRLLMTRPPSNSPRTLKVLESIVLTNAHSQTTVSVIIPTLNEETMLERTILSAGAQRFSRAEVVVVDGGSQDRTLEIANRCADRVVVVKRPGRQHQENVGAKGAKGDVLVFLHADTQVSPTLLRSITESLEDPSIVGGGAHLTYSPPRLRYRAICKLREMVSDLLGIFGIGASFFVRREAFHGLGGFDEEVNEEGVDMSKKLRKLGKMVMLHEIVQTSARRYERSGFIKTFCAWALTVALTYSGIRSSSIERYIWRAVR